MKLWDLIKPKKKDIFEEYAANLKPLQPLQPIQVQEGIDGGADVAPEQVQIVEARPSRLKGVNGKLSNLLFGTSATPTDSISTTDGVMNVTISDNPKTGGFLRDLVNGTKENYDNEFQVDNWVENQTPDGRKKGFAYRLGEGLGSVARGLAGWAGDAWTAGYSGLDAGMNRQAIRTGDKIYRDELIRTMQNSLINSPEYLNMSEDERAQALNNIADQINGIRGYISSDMYNNFVRAQQLRDNADYRNMMANLQAENNRAIQDLRRDQAEYQKIKDAADREDRALTRAITARGQDLNYGLGMARLNADAQKANAAQSAKQKDALSTLNQIDLIRGMVRQNPKATGLGKGMITGDLLNRWDNNPNNIQTRTAIDALRTKIRHDLTGAQFSPKEAREYEKFLPNVRDNAQIINAKLDALEKRYYSDFGVSLGVSTAPKKVGKYTVRVK